eukprot:SAG11_NODE_2973_length_2800_cov_1.339134_3_plen_96_part_00
MCEQVVAAAPHKGQLPRTVEGLLKIPGIGPYTAGAIASISYGLAVPTLSPYISPPLQRRAISSSLALIFRSLYIYVPPGQAYCFNSARAGSALLA